jgi:hypothetical protein
MSTRFVRGSEEYLEFTLDERDGQDLTGDTTEVALVIPGATSFTWLPCVHVVGNVWRTSSVIVWSVANFPARQYRAWARVTDLPETPMADLGFVTFVAP